MVAAGKGAPECPVFYPTIQEVNSMTFVEYVEKLEKQRGFREAGVCKIVAPDGWAPRRTGYNRLNFELPRPIRQHATGRQGLYRTLMVESRRMPLDEFRDMAREEVHAAPRGAEPEELERQFWRNVTLNPPLYGADVPGSLFEPACKGWTLRRLSSLLSQTLEAHGVKMPGVNEPYLYVGSWRSMFAWHTEDMDLHSVNYLHAGASKQWYVVPPAHRPRFERLMRSLLQDLFRACPEFMRHKELLVSPQLLASHAIPVVKVVHHPREFVVVFPGAYHSGFNHGFNIAESVNFATRAWLPIGAEANYCECQADSARIDMRLFREHMPPKLRRQVDEMYASSSSDEEESEGEGDGEAEAEEDSSPGSAEEEEEDSEAPADSSCDEDEGPPEKRRRRQQQQQQRGRKGRPQQPAPDSEAESTSDVEVEESEGEAPPAAKRAHSGRGGRRAADAANRAPPPQQQEQQQQQAAAAPSGRPQRTRRPPRRDMDMVPVRLRPPPAASMQLQAAAKGRMGLVSSRPAPQPGLAASTASRKRSRSRSLAARSAAAAAASPAAKLVGTSSRGRPLLLKIMDSAASLLPFSAQR